MSYWDSCAIIPLCIDDDIFSECTRSIAINDDGIVTWWGTPIECCSAFARLRRENRITAEEEQQSRSRLNRLIDTWSEVEPSNKIKTVACQLLLRQPLRAADAFQLAAAIVWADGEPEGRRFVSYDKRLREAAQSEGFTVIPVQ